MGVDINRRWGLAVNARGERGLLPEEEKEEGRNGGDRLFLKAIMSAFIDLLVFPSHLEHEFSDQDKVWTKTSAHARVTAHRPQLL